MIWRWKILSLLISILVYSSPARAQNRSSPICNRSCHGGSSSKTVPFPFGFSSDCTIQLNCSNSGEITLGDLRVLNFTSRTIIVELSAQCNRSINSIKPLIGPNLGLSSANSLLLQDCTNTTNRCQIPMSVFERRLPPAAGCRSGDSLSCFSQEGEFDVMEFEAVKRSSCESLFGSFAVDSSGSLEFQRLEFVWWLNGSCGGGNGKCDRNGECVDVNLGRGKLGFQCECPVGFHGDGVVADYGGSGCHKVRKCNVGKYLTGQCGGMTKVGVLVAGIICGAVLMASLTFLCHVVRRRSACLKSRMSAKRLLCEAAGNSSVALYPYKEIEKATNYFAESQRLGTGAFGMVYAGKLNNDELVAIKKIKYRDHNTIDQVMNEIKLLSSVSHPNLVRLIGCCIDQGEQILVYEFMPNGTLSQQLQRERGRGLPWTTRLTIASETANAIAYLHTAINPPIYHRDIKSSNILLDYGFKSKVADFGLSRLGMMETSHISTAPQGTPGYVDPQYHQNFHLSDKSDVYSFGVVLLEIITALKVVDFTRPQSEVNLAALAVDRIGKGCVDEIIDPFLEPHRDAWTLYSVNKVAELAFRCLAFHSDTRPSMVEVAEELEQIRRSGWVTMEENVFASSAVSSCSSPYNGSESMGSMGSKKAGMGSQRVLISQKLNDMEEGKDSSPISIEDPWFSEQSSPSTNSLLGNIVR